MTQFGECWTAFAVFWNLGILEKVYWGGRKSAFLRATFAACQGRIGLESVRAADLIYRHLVRDNVVKEGVR